MLLALAAYGAVVLAIGLGSARASSRSAESFVVGERSFGTFATWAALSSTTIGGSTTLVLAALVASRGLPGLWLDLAGALGLLGLGVFLAARVRRTGALTISDVIGRLYGPVVRKIAAVLTILAEVVWFALLTQATETVVATATSWDPTTVLVATAAVFVLYTAIGGQRAVVGTDVFQFALMAIAIVGIAAPLALRSIARTGVPAELLTFPTGPRFGWTDALALLVLVGLPHMVGGDVWAKVLSAKDEKTARRASLFAALSKLAFGLAAAAIALAGIGLSFPASPALFPRTVLALAGDALAPFVLVAMLATMQSSSDSVLLSAAAATSHDLAGGLSPAASRAFVFLYGALGLAVALLVRDLVETFRLGYTLFASGLILPTLVAFVPGVTVLRSFAGTAMVLGGVAAMVERFLHPIGLDPVLVGTGVNGLVLLAGLRRAQPRAGMPAPREA